MNNKQNWEKTREEEKSKINKNYSINSLIHIIKEEYIDNEMNFKKERVSKVWTDYKYQINDWDSWDACFEYEDWAVWNGFLIRFEDWSWSRN